MRRVGIGRGVIVLGGSPIGAAIGRAFRDAGDTVVCLARDQPPVDAFHGWIAVDCGDSGAAQVAVDAARADLGGFSVLVLAAARMPLGRVDETSDEAWRQAIDDGLTAAFHLLRAALPHIESGGVLVAVGSTNSFLASPAVAAYAAAKAGLEGLIRQVALDYGRFGIRANTVAPALIDRGQRGAAAEGYPLGRVGCPEDVARAVVFLASSDASFITGVTLPVDGGLSIASPAAFLRPDLLARINAPRRSPGG